MFSVRFCLTRLLVFFFVNLGWFHSASALEWRVVPGLTYNEMFSDNLTLSSANKKSGFVTEISPSLSLNTNSAWSDFNLFYRLQGLQNAGGRDEVDLNSQLQMNSKTQLIRNRLFLDSSSSISQQNVNNSLVVADNLTGQKNRTEVKTFSISPYWNHQIGQYANLLLRASYDKASFDNNNVFNNNALLSNLLTDTDTFSETASLNSGSAFSKLQWNLYFSDKKQSSVSGRDVSFQHSEAGLRYFIAREYNVFGQFGYDDNSFSTINSSSSNGFFYTFGGQWRPSPWYSVEVGIGNNKHITVSFNPIYNLSGSVTFRNKDVGLNKGDSWDSSIIYTRGMANWSFNYRQETSTVQQQILKQISETYKLVDMSTNQVLGLLTYVGNTSRLVDDVLVIKTANLGFTYQTGKSTFNANAFSTKRTYELNADDEDTVFGVSGGWQWAFEPNLRFYVQPLWQSIDT